VPIIREYSSYRGRRPRGNMLLAVLLVLVILAALSVLLLQRYIVYDASGTPTLDLPWLQGGEEAPETLPPLEDFELIIQAPPADETSTETAEWSVLELPSPLTEDVWQQAQGEASADAVAVTLKDSTGTVWYDSAAAVSDAVVLTEDSSTLLAEITGGALHSVARIHCFPDSKAAGHDVEGKGLKDTNGYIFYDGNNRQWLDPGKTEARAYLCALAAEAAALGFDEVLLSNIGYPAEGRLDQIVSAAGEDGRAANIEAFLKEMRLALDAYELRLCVELPESVLLEGSEETSALVLSKIAPQVNGIYVRAPQSRREALAAALTAAAPDLSLVLLPAGEAQTP